MENPYAPPTATDARVRAESPLFTKIARLSWVLPLASLAVTVVLNTAFRQIPIIGIVGFLAFAGGTLIGLVLAIIGLVAALRYQRVFKHAISGFATSVLLLLLIVALFQATAMARDAARRARARDNLNEAQQALDQYKAHQKSP